MPNSTIFSGIQLSPASSRGTHGMLDRLNLACFSLACLLFGSSVKVLLSWFCAFYHSGERDVGFGCRIQTLGHS